MNCHRLGGLNYKLIFLAVLLSGSARSGWQQGQVLDEGSLLGLQMALFLLGPQVVEGERQGEGERKGMAGQWNSQNTHSTYLLSSPSYMSIAEHQ